MQLFVRFDGELGDCIYNIDNGKEGPGLKPIINDLQKHDCSQSFTIQVPSLELARRIFASFKATTRNDDENYRISLIATNHTKRSFVVEVRKFYV